MSPMNHGQGGQKHKKQRLAIFDNMSYKLVSLFIAFVLWISILGRRDFVATQEVEINFVSAPGYSILSQSHDRVKIKISGQQPQMKKYKDKIQVINVDVTDKESGIYDMDIMASRFELPAGLRILNIRPNSIKFEIIKK
ncbi:MAG: hypothetical protein H7235_09875 [Bdellovibrionaceae bacterium]|nr:hypothetical protein [Pseudobdellovibrionaceae bacterium]